MNARNTTIIITFVVTLAASVFGPVSMAEADDIDPDVRALAKSQGVSISSAQKQTEWQQQSGAVVARLRRNAPNTFVSADLRSADREGTIVFNSDPDPVVRRKIEAVGGLYVEVRTGVLSEKDRKVAVARAHFAVLQSEGVADAVTYAQSNGVIQVNVELGDGVSADSAEIDMIQAVASRSSGLPVSVGVAGDVSGTEQDEDEHGPLEMILYGGAVIEQDAFQAVGRCTAGFTLVNTNGADFGMSTAAHCRSTENPERNFYRSSLGSPNAAKLFYGGTINSRYGDAMWLKFGGGDSTNYPGAAYWRDYSELQSVVGVEDAEVGNLVSNFGQTTGYKAPVEVYMRDVCVSIYCGLTVVEEHITDGGDSGGPWFWAGFSHGVHHGWILVDGVARSAFTDVSAFRTGGMTVMTS